MSRIITQFWVYVLPLPMSLAMYFVWAAWSGNRIFACYVMLLPLVYGYVAPGIATNLLRKWRFKGPWLVGNYYAHHGFMYSANMTPLLFVAFLGTPHETVSAATATRILLCTGALHGFVLWAWVLNDWGCPAKLVPMIFCDCAKISIPPLVKS